MPETPVTLGVSIDGNAFWREDRVRKIRIVVGFFLVLYITTAFVLNFIIKTMELDAYKQEMIWFIMIPGAVAISVTIWIVECKFERGLPCTNPCSFNSNGILQEI